MVLLVLGGDEVNSLQFLIMDGRLMWNYHDLSDENAAVLSSWAEIGDLQSFRLEKSNFDNLFVNDEIWAEGYTPESIRENTDNTEKAKTEHEWNGQKQFFYILQQQNGILILCRGFYGDDGKPFIRFVYRLEYIGGEMEEPDHVLVNVDSILKTDLQTRKYSYEESVEPVIKPSIVLAEEDKTFTFTWSMFSSYYACGTYELTESTLVLRTEDGQNTYTFDVADEDSFVFRADKSSPIPEYRYTAGGIAQCPVPDGAVFKADGH